MAIRAVASPSPPRQRGLSFPVRVVRMDPANLSGVHTSKQICVCDDSVSYAMKDDTQFKFLPHCEWFCTFCQFIGTRDLRRICSSISRPGHRFRVAAPLFITPI